MAHCEQKKEIAYSEYEPHSVTAKRYRTSNYFLNDQLKCSEAIHDFQSVKTLVNGLPQFSLRSKFEFIEQPVVASKK